ncbi:MAG: PocR ligand-binding domain-containing protein [Clostridia bacterium]
MRDAIEFDTVLRELYSISGLRISVHDTKFNEITAYPKELFPFCKLIQGNPSAREICLKDDACAFCVAKKREGAYIYRCHFGLFEAVAPIYNFGILAGYLMMGQTLDITEGSRRYAAKQASAYIPDVSSLKCELARVPTNSREKLSSCLSIMTICAEYITLMNYLDLGKRDVAEELMRYINENYASKISIELLCKRFFCSKSTLMNVFKKQYNKTIMEYLTDVRLTHAEKLLKTGDSTIYGVATQCGFLDQNYFSKVFAKKYGVSPTAYRKHPL